MTTDHLGEFEQVVLLAVARLGDEAYGVSILREIETRGRRTPSLGAIYATLTRLEEKGYLRSWEGGASARRGGRAKRYFALEPAGVKALRHSRLMLDRMWEGLDLDPRPSPS